MKVCVIGTGYVGLVTGVCLAHMGHDVICIDNNEQKVKLMQSGRSPIYEPGLSELMQSSMQSGKLQFSSDLAAGVNHGEIMFVAVGTPALPNGESDTRYVEAVAKGIGEHLPTDVYKVIVNKSTVPIGSGDWVRMIVLDGVKQKSNGNSAAVQFDVVSNPEFLREGSAIYDTFNPDRIVLGSSSSKAIALMKQLYEPLISGQYSDATTVKPIPVVETDLNSAEMIKYAANAFLATKISFINEVANVCDRVGADILQVAKGIGLDSRIGNKFLQAGLGWGGSCFPKDVSALIHTAEDYGYQTQLLAAAVEVNKRQKLIVIEKLQQELKILKGKTIGLLGLTFKPDTDDMRDAPSLNLIAELNRLGARVKAYDPIVSQNGISHGLTGVLIESNPEMLADDCDALVLVTDWAEFRELDYQKLGDRLQNRLMIDGRNFLDRQALVDLGFRYIGIGH